MIVIKVLILKINHMNHSNITFESDNDLFATGGSVNCFADILNSKGKTITGISIFIELKDLNPKSKFSFPVESQVIY